MAGKYASVIGKLPRIMEVLDKPDYQEKVNVVKAEILKEDQTPVSLATNYTELRVKRDEIEEVAKELNLRLEAVSQLLVEFYEAEGVSSLRLTGGRSVTVQVEPYAIVKDRDALREWAIQNGLERSLTLPWQTTNAIAKERLLNGEPEPDGVETHAKNKIVLR